MAINYVIISEHRTVQVLSSTFVQDVMDLGVQTVPSSIYFEALLPLDEWDTAFVGAYLDPLANELEGWFAYTGGGVGSVLAMTWREDIDDQGLQKFWIDFTLTVPSPGPSQPGPFTAVASVPWDDFGAPEFMGPTIEAILDATFATLAGTVAL